MRITDTSDLWWKSAVVYCLDIETFLDADGDGTGDIQGLTQRIDYLAELGITCLWLMPFYPSPDRDDGYDVKDYLGVDERLGDLGRVVELVRLAHDRGIRVVADLVVNHTSDQHPWFRASRREADPAKNPYRDYYIWRSEEPGDTSDQVVFPDAEDAIWTQDEKTGEWYLHHFYRHQPDLNLDNPAVVEELLRAVGFWLQVGFDGFRVDGVPFFGQHGDKEGPDEAVDPHAFTRTLRDFLNRRKGDAVLLGEVNLPYEEQLAFFGGGSADELHMQFDFIGMQATYLSLARADARPLVTALQAVWLAGATIVVMPIPMRMGSIEEFVAATRRRLQRADVALFLIDPDLAPQPTPIKGQVARLIRLGSPGRSSLSRMQFLAGGRPTAATTINEM